MNRVKFADTLIVPDVRRNYATKRENGTLSAFLMTGGSIELNWDRWQGRPDRTSVSLKLTSEQARELRDFLNSQLPEGE